MTKLSKNKICKGEFMTSQELVNYFNQYGLIVILGIMYLEGLNLTGIPAMVLLPAIGIFINYSSYSFFTVLGVSVLGSMLGNITYYAIVKSVGPKIYNYFYNKFKRIRKSLDKTQEMSEKHGNKVCLIGRLMPGARTVVTLLTATFGINIKSFILYSLGGITIWNFILILIGYMAGGML